MLSSPFTENRSRVSPGFRCVRCSVWEGESVGHCFCFPHILLSPRQSTAPFVSFLIPDQIDENLKLALQQDLTSMAPGLVIQVSIASVGSACIGPCMFSPKGYPFSAGTPGARWLLHPWPFSFSLQLLLVSFSRLYE